MAEKLDVKQGTLALMILKTLEGLGPLHGYGIARRIEETSRNPLSLKYGTLYPAPRPPPRLRHPPPYRGNEQEPALPQLRHPLPRPPQARAGRVHQGRVAAVREQPPREVLRAHCHRAETARSGNPRMARDRGPHRRVPR